MSANVETMFYTRVAPWHGLGVRVESSLSSTEAIEQSGLNWNVIQRPIMTSNYAPIPGYDAPDLKGHVGKNAYRFICAVSDFATHSKPLRDTANYRKNVFGKMMEGNPLIDKAYELVQAAA